ncbi:MAG: hypothetical protein WBE48_12870 [Xanthobacteraceae bacterium]|jgi:hypothetical protein
MELGGSGHVGFAVRLSASGIFGASDRTNKRSSVAAGEVPMANTLLVRALLVRMASAVGLIALSLFFVGLIPFLSAGPSSGAGFPAKVPATSVNREFKGDRLPLPSDANSAFSKNDPQHPQDAKQILDGCDPSFSLITTPRLSNIYGRCTT